MWQSIKYSKYVKINSVNPLYFIINKVNEYFEEIIRNKYLTLFIRDLIMSVTKNLGDYDENYMKIKFNSDDELPSMIIAVRAVLH